jgi:hypothetical protein
VLHGLRYLRRMVKRCGLTGGAIEIHGNNRLDEQLAINYKKKKEKYCTQGIHCTSVHQAYTSSWCVP